MIILLIAMPPAGSWRIAARNVLRPKLSKLCAMPWAWCPGGACCNQRQRCVVNVNIADLVYPPMVPKARHYRKSHSPFFGSSLACCRAMLASCCGRSECSDAKCKANEPRKRRRGRKMSEQAHVAVSISHEWYVCTGSAVEHLYQVGSRS